MMPESITRQLERDYPPTRSLRKAGAVGLIMARPLWFNDGSVLFVLRVAHREPRSSRNVSVQRRGTVRKYYHSTYYATKYHTYEVIFAPVDEELQRLHSCSNEAEARRGMRDEYKRILAELG